MILNPTTALPVVKAAEPSIDMIHLVIEGSDLSGKVALPGPR